jgi:hypothetical protein
MGDEAFERDWAALSADVLSGMSDWRAQHPRATLSEIEGELDGRLARLRARLLERVAQQNAATTWRQAAKDLEGAVPTGPPCRRVRRADGSAGRHVAGAAGASDAPTAERGGPGAPGAASRRRLCAVWTGAFPPGCGTRPAPRCADATGAGPVGPSGHLDALRSRRPDARALHRGPDQRRDGADVPRRRDEVPPVPAGSDTAVVSVDGAMGPMRGGEWAEVK